jgi:hypothetical protein
MLNRTSSATARAVRVIAGTAMAVPALGLAVGVLARPAVAQDITDRVEVHGYGGWGYGRTTSNESPNFYNFAHKRGDYSHSEFALNLAVPISDRLQVTAQPFWHAGHHANQTESGIDYAFGEWKFSDLARFRAGLVKHPFGIYTEVFDVGTLRPFATLPQSVYGPTGMVGKAYSGVGLTGTRFVRTGWGVTYDAYVGGLEVAERDAALQVAAEGADTTAAALNLSTTKTFRDVVGGRLVLQTPIDGLSVGASGYTGTRPVGVRELRRNVTGVHAEFLHDDWSVRGELAHEREDDQMRRHIDGAYVEAAYQLTEQWQLATLYSTLDSKLAGADPANVARAPSLLKHEEWGFGLNFWFTPNFVLKGSYHVVDGNRFAAPEQNALRALVARDGIVTQTGVVLFGANLSF